MKRFLAWLLTLSITFGCGQVPQSSLFHDRTSADSVSEGSPGDSKSTRWDYDRRGRVKILPPDAAETRPPQEEGPRHRPGGGNTDVNRQDPEGRSGVNPLREGQRVTIIIIERVIVIESKDQRADNPPPPPSSKPIAEEKKPLTEEAGKDLGMPDADQRRGQRHGDAPTVKRSEPMGRARTIALEELADREAEFQNLAVRALEAAEDLQEELNAAARSHNAGIDQLPAAEEELERWIQEPEPISYNLKSSPYSYHGQKVRDLARHVERAKRNPTPDLPQDAISQLSEAADRAVMTADSSYAQGEIQEGDLAVEVGYAAADMLLGMIPVVGWALDCAKAISGYGIDGKPLSTEERTLAFLGALTVGIASKAAVAIKALKIITKISGPITRAISRAGTIVKDGYRIGLRSAQEFKVYARYHDAIKTLPDALLPKRMRVGSNGKVAIIGRSMGGHEDIKGVRDVASKLQDAGHDVEIFDGDIISRAAKEEFALLKQRFGTSIPDDMIPETLMYRENMAWAKKVKDERYTIFDLGNPNDIDELSPWYEMEKRVIFGD